MRAADLQLFQKTALYQEVGGQVARRLTRDCPIQTFPKDAILTRQGEQAGHVHLILSGRVALCAECSDGDSTVITTFASGEIFVGAAAILRLPYLVSARTTTASRILSIPSERFRLALAADHSLAMMMVNYQARHWRMLVGHLQELKLHSGVERLAYFLVRHSNAPDGPAAFRLDCDRRTVAAELGMSPEFLSRTFQQLRKHGVQARGSQIMIEDVGRLCRLYRPVNPRSQAAGGHDDGPEAPAALH